MNEQNFNQNPKENINNNYYPEYATEVAPKPDTFKQLYIPPEGITAIQEYINLYHGEFHFGHLFNIVRFNNPVLDKIAKLAPDLLVDIESLKQNPACISCFSNITNKINAIYSEDPIAREAVNEIICNDPYLLAGVREINNVLKRHEYICNSVHNIPKQVGAWADFLNFLKKERIRFTNLNVVDPGPGSRDLHVYIVPAYKAVDLI